MYKYNDFEGVKCHVFTDAINWKYKAHKNITIKCFIKVIETGFSKHYSRIYIKFTIENESLNVLFGITL